ncbi:hypothetical protein J8N05_05755 [Streptomyces sp. BH-SS-21]|uniref:Uncharacterized protein n=1 Tax=Streptomyces liliiviolaceus TaxID=2823109 RepID=A0A940XZ16_9ACTN|nr:hypothetical protein [Streptomyces liliiviolaceus]MBQ0847719.1 hypothetical protein [Streptomyces liliiviolaceus]
MLFEIAILLGFVVPPLVRLTIGLVALRRCDSGDVPDVVKALAVGKKIK